MLPSGTFVGNVFDQVRCYTSLHEAFGTVNSIVRTVGSRCHHAVITKRFWFVEVLATLFTERRVQQGATADYCEVLKLVAIAGFAEG